ncbi:hypothetical protein D3H65_05665 [Paraflavitalea soli]|uniref:Uncharacterized protein n=1 Tax=Paraflavitalea soli TaxID=2315862 RepID=A0A3B7MPK7_9BACT|nr:hypothetical protein [Paraflavitalea soli]AXY73495.1 hypothetical protein D3H65_05665 [Paraflavitalea soli]
MILPLLPAARFLQLSQRITLYPSLVTERRFWLQLYNIERGVFTIYFYTLSGVLLFKSFLAHKEHFSTHTICLPVLISTGIYKVAVCCGDSHYLQTIVIR